MQYRDTCNELSVHLSLPTISTVANTHAHVTLTSIDYAVIYIYAKLTSAYSWKSYKVARNALSTRLLKFTVSVKDLRN